MGAGDGFEIGVSPARVSEVVAGHYDRLFGVAYRVLGSAEEAEDVVQDVCLELPGKLSEFRGEAALSTWLFRVATNRAIDAYRARKRHREKMTAWGEVEALRRAEAAEAEAARDWLDDLMQSLEAEDRATVALVVSEGMSQAEAAELLGVAPGTIAWRMSRIRERLRAADREEVA